jgi:hypothetical protein
MADAVQRQALNDPRQTEAVVAVEVGDADVRDLRGRQAGQQHLPLRPLAGVEEDAQFVPLQEDGVVIARPRRHLAGGAEERHLADRHLSSGVRGQETGVK